MSFLATNNSTRSELKGVVAVADTSVASLNLGDQVIARSTVDELRRTIPSSRILTVGTHVPLGARGRQIVRHAAVTVVAGSNLLGNNTGRVRPIWRAQLQDLAVRRKFVLVGVGTTHRPTPRWRMHPYLQLQLLSRHLPHSVREKAALDLLQQHGFENVELTGCVTTWALQDLWIGHEARVRSESVVVTASRGEAEPLQQMLEKIVREYRTIYYWPQRLTDQPPRWLQALPDVRFLTPTLEAVRDALVNEGADYVGTRLHGGIFALQHLARTLIVPVDHRASGIDEVSGLPLARPNDHEKIEQFLDGPYELNVTVPTDAILRWRDAIRAAVTTAVGSSPDP